MTVMQHLISPWDELGLLSRLRPINGSGEQPDSSRAEMSFAVPADGVVPLHIQVHPNTGALDIDVSF